MKIEFGGCRGSDAIMIFQQFDEFFFRRVEAGESIPIVVGIILNG